MFTTVDKALIALILALLSILNLVFGIDWFGNVTEETIGVIVSVLMPVLVWLIPNRET